MSRYKYGCKGSDKIMILQSAMNKKGLPNKYISAGEAPASPNNAYTNGSGDPNDTRAGQLTINN